MATNKYPKELLIEINRKCFLNCQFCSSNSLNSSKLYIDLKVFQQILSNIENLNISTIQISGGEPLCHPQIEEILKELRKHPQKKIIYTSGNLYKDNALIPLSDDIFSILLENNIKNLRFNLQSHISSIHNELTNRESFENTITSIKRAIENQIVCEIHILPVKQNYLNLFQTIDFFKSLGIKKVKILKFLSSGRGNLNSQKLKLDVSELAELSLIFSKIKKEYREFIEFGAAFSNKYCNHQCVIRSRKIVITPNLFVFPCVSLKNSELFQFQIKNRSLESILNSDEYNSCLNSFLKKYAKNNTCPSQVYYS